MNNQNHHFVMFCYLTVTVNFLKLPLLLQKLAHERGNQSSIFIELDQNLSDIYRKYEKEIYIQMSSTSQLLNHKRRTIHAKNKSFIAEIA